MNGIRVYIEGGGDSAPKKAELRRGFQAFLQPLRELAQDKRLQWDVILCGSRGSAYSDYCIALRSHPDSINILLVDAEAPVAGGAWTHLVERDRWENPGVGEDRCHLMVQTVEAWLIADPDALQAYYGQGFHRGALPARRNVEDIPKADVLKALQQASKKTSKGEYHKIKHCAALLAKINANKVRLRAGHCERLFTTIEGILAGP